MKDVGPLPLQRSLQRESKELSCRGDEELSASRTSVSAEMLMDRSQSDLSSLIGRCAFCSAFNFKFTPLCTSELQLREEM